MRYRPKRAHRAGAGFCRQFLLFFLTFVASVSMHGMRAIAAEVTPEQVEDAIKKGKAFLYSKQQNGNWEAVQKPSPIGQSLGDPSGMQFGGTTAIATFALLNCGDTPQENEKLKAAVEWLEKADIRGTYALGLRAQIWSLLPDDPVIRKVARRDRDLLIAGVHTKGEATGFYSYGQGVDLAQGQQSTSEQYDHSVSQFGVLGLWSLVQEGQEVDTNYWRLFDKSWRQHQQADGGWGYLAHLNDPRIGGPEGLKGEELSMTAAGVATLFITQEYSSVAAKCEGNIKDPNIEAGMGWVGTHLKDIDANEWAAAWHYYTMFGICRIGLASGYKYIGAINWFQWGAQMLIRDQNQDSGAWTDQDSVVLAPGTVAIDPRVFNSSFALLFLSRGRAPILFNKLEYNLASASKKPPEGNWNQRPRDIANLTRYIGKEREIAMNWQIVNLQQPVEDLLDAPMLYMAGGSQAFKLSPADIYKLRSYVNQGGLIVGHADCASVPFCEGFKKLGEAMFPGTTFHELPADHPIYTLESFSPKTWMPKPRVEVLENGARVRMILLANGDPAREWQTQNFQKIKKYSMGQLMMDIYLYAVDKQPLLAKGDTFLVKRLETGEAGTPMKIARLKYAGNWDPEPGGWPRLSNIMHNKDHLDLTIVQVELGNGSLTNQFKLADLTGTAALNLTDPQVAELKKYIEGGGTVLMDAAGGKTAFVVSAQDLLTKLVPGSKLPKTLPHSSPVYTSGADPIKEVSYRQFARSTLGNLHVPQLRGVEVGGRIAVLLSNEDLAVGLVGQPVDGIIGYDPASAVHVVENLLVYLAKPNAAATTAPAAVMPVP
jgi:hypothetical protein